MVTIKAIVGWTMLVVFLSMIWLRAKRTRISSNKV